MSEKDCENPPETPWICHGSEAKQLIAAEGHLNKLQGDGAIMAAEAALKTFRSAGSGVGSYADRVEDLWVEDLGIPKMVGLFHGKSQSKMDDD